MQQEAEVGRRPMRGRQREDHGRRPVSSEAGAFQERRVAGRGTAASVCACQTDQESFCICETEMCITLEFTNCNLCIG
jgi:hypothetical protein